jgi:F-type H+-transporting ATPase subunit a
MNSRLIAIGATVLFLVGFIFLRGPTPHIAIKAEALTRVGSIAITNTMITSWVIVVLIAAGVLAATRKWTLIPSGIQNFVEAAMEGFYTLVTNISPARRTGAVSSRWWPRSSSSL